MATSLLVLIDDIAAVLDDVAVLAQVAAKKTAGVLGDDLALNAQQVAGVQADRELPVVWAVCKGSFVNKAILVPAALLLSAFAPWAVMPLLMLGGLFLCFEGFEKVAHKLTTSSAEEAAHRAALVQTLADSSVDMVALERDKIKGAIRTDFILSTEIIVIALGIVQGSTLTVQIGVLSGIAIAMTVGVYGLVACIVKLDDFGLYLTRPSAIGAANATRRVIGVMILRAAPWLMKALAVLGTVAMFLVGGGILAHGLPGVGAWIEHLSQATLGASAPLLSVVLNGFLGVAAGALTLAVVWLIGNTKAYFVKK
jgi:predicted DNA repair protein MutK